MPAPRRCQVTLVVTDSGRMAQSATLQGKLTSESHARPITPSCTAAFTPTMIVGQAAWQPAAPPARARRGARTRPRIPAPGRSPDARAPRAPCATPVVPPVPGTRPGGPYSVVAGESTNLDGSGTACPAEPCSYKWTIACPNRTAVIVEGKFAQVTTGLTSDRLVSVEGLREPMDCIVTLEAKGRRRRRPPLRPWAHPRAAHGRSPPRACWLAACFCAARLGPKHTSAPHA